MSKQASDLTLAIRGLFEETKGDITHLKARPRLEKMGFQVVRNPSLDLGRQTPELTAWEGYTVDYDDPASIEATASACSFDEATLKAVLQERKIRATFKSERNSFDVTKNNWKKNKASGKHTPSRKPQQ